MEEISEGTSSQEFYGRPTSVGMNGKPCNALTHTGQPIENVVMSRIDETLAGVVSSVGLETIRYAA